MQSQHYLTFSSLKVIWVSFVSTVMEVQVLSQVMLFKLYCKNHKKYMDKLCGQNAECVGMLKEVVCILTADLQGWYCVCRCFCSQYVCFHRWIPSPSVSPHTFASCRFIGSVYWQTTVLYYFPPFCAKNSTDCLSACVCVCARARACLHQQPSLCHPTDNLKPKTDFERIFVWPLTVHIRRPYVIWSSFAIMDNPAWWSCELLSWSW